MKIEGLITYGKVDKDQITIRLKNANEKLNKLKKKSNDYQARGLNSLANLQDRKIRYRMNQVKELEKKLKEF